MLGRGGGAFTSFCEEEWTGIEGEERDDGRWEGREGRGRGRGRRRRGREAEGNGKSKGRVWTRKGQGKRTERRCGRE